MATTEELRARAETTTLRERATSIAFANNEIDTETGAPAFVRALVGGAPTPGAQLETLRKFYPGAMPGLDEGNFLFRSPETGRVTVFNPSDLDVGDVASVTRVGFQVVGGTAGAIGGGAAGTTVLPGPGTAVGAVSGAGVGTALGGILFDELASALGMADPRTVQERAQDAALDIALGGGGQAVGGAIGLGLRGATKTLLRGGAAGRKEVASAISDLARFNASPSLAQATKKPALDAAETFISRIPGGAGRIRTAVDKMNKAVAAAVDRIAKSLAGGKIIDPELAGRAISIGIKGIDGFVERFMGRSEALFNKLDEFIPADTAVLINNTKATLADLVTPVPGAEATSGALVTPGLKRISDAILADIGDPGTLPYGALKRLRSAIGRKLSSSELVSEIPRAEMKQLYAAITRDMEAVAVAAGPKAELAFARAMRFYRSGIKRIDETLEPLIKNKVFENVFEAIELSGKRGPTRIRVLRRSLTDVQWRTVVSSIVRRLGRAKPGQQDAGGGLFSFNTFLTNWNSLDDAAKNALFNGTGLSGLRQNLDALARAAARIRESSQAFANPSGTAGSLIGQGVIMGGMIGGPAAGVMAGSITATLFFPAALAMVTLGANAGARLVTNPSFVSWLARSTRIEAGGAAAHIGRLATIASTSDPETRDALKEFLSIFETSATETAKVPKNRTRGTLTSRNNSGTRRP